MRTISPSSTCSGAAGRLAGAAGRLATRSHRDQSGTMSILSVFAVLLLTILLGMLMNVGRQVDGKIRMQNAADAAAYSGGVVLTRGFNSLAFTNHLLSEVFTMTGILQALHNRDAEKYVPDILNAWQAEAPVLGGSPFPKFADLGPAIAEKAPLEQTLVTAFGDWGQALADDGALALMETILGDPNDPTTHLITNYQRAVVAAIPDMAQQAANTVANKNGDQPDAGRGVMSGVLWQTCTGQPQPLDPGYLASLVVDPNSDASEVQVPAVVSDARLRRDALAGETFAGWSGQIMRFFDYGAKMSRFSDLWRNFAYAEMQSLLAAYPNTNLPLELNSQAQPAAGGTTPDFYDPLMDQYYTFVAVVYWGKGTALFSGVYKSPIDSDLQAYAQLRVFVPTSRLVWRESFPNASSSIPLGGPPGYQWPSDPSSSPGVGTWVPGRQFGVSTDWDLWNQHWTCQLVPATHPTVPAILSTRPLSSQPNLPDLSSYTLPNLQGVSADDLNQVSYH